jgi:hypothetical protein
MSGHGGVLISEIVDGGAREATLRPATPKPARKQDLLLARTKLPYIVDPDGPVRAIAPVRGSRRGGAKAHTQPLREAPSYC